MPVSVDPEARSSPTWGSLAVEYLAEVAADLWDATAGRVDLYADGDTITWQWWKARVWGLLSKPPSGYYETREGMRAILTTRVQRAVMEASPDADR